MRHLALVLTLATLAAADVVIVTQVADADDQAEASAPEVNDFSRTVIDEVQVAVRVDLDGRFLIDLHNPNDTARDVGFHLDCYAMTGSYASRMGPMRTQVSTDLIVASLEPGERQTQLLGCARSTPKEVQNPAIAEVIQLRRSGPWNNGFGRSFTSYDFEVRDVLSRDIDVNAQPVLAVLRPAGEGIAMAQPWRRASFVAPPSTRIN